MLSELLWPLSYVTKYLYSTFASTVNTLLHPLGRGWMRRRLLRRRRRGTGCAEHALGLSSLALNRCRHLHTGASRIGSEGEGLLLWRPKR